MPSGSATASAIADRGARELELLDRLGREEVRVVADEADRLDERVGVGGVEDHRAVTRAQGVTARRSRTSAASQTSASATASTPAE